MSKHYNSYTPDSVTRAIIHMSIEEIAEHYGIEIAEDGRVYDPMDNRRFDSVTEWALYMDEVEQQAEYAAGYHGNTRYAFDDD